MVGNQHFSFRSTTCHQPHGVRGQGREAEWFVKENSSEFTAGALNKTVVTPISCNVITGYKTELDISVTPNRPVLVGTVVCLFLSPFNNFFFCVVVVCCLSF